MESPSLAITQKLAGHGPKQLSVIDMALSSGIGVGRHPSEVLSNFSCCVIFMRGFKRATTISVVVEMKQNAGGERQNIFVCLFWQPDFLFFFSISFLTTA